MVGIEAKLIKINNFITIKCQAQPPGGGAIYSYRYNLEGH